MRREDEQLRALSRRSMVAALMAVLPTFALAEGKGETDPGPQADRDPYPPPPDPPDDILLEATETVQLEHDDRIFRLRAATQRLGIYPAPDFSTSVVPARRMPENFHVDTPVLRVTFAEQVFFNSDSDDLRPEAARILDAVAESLRGDAPDAAVFVSGHTDNRGSEDHNYNLSINRANAVAESLLDRGVGEVALWRVGFGEAVPLYPNDTPDHMGFNRRVEFLFASRTEPILDYLSRQLDTVCIAGTPRQSERCRREVTVRERFTAVQLTRRPIGVGLSRNPPTRLASARPATVTRPPSPAVSTPPTVAPPSARSRTPPPRRTAVAAPPAERRPAQASNPASSPPPVASRPAPRTSVNVDSVPVVSQEVAINLRSRQATVNTSR